MLKELVEQNHYLFVEKIDTWQEAIRMSCKTLEQDNSVDSSYAEEIIACVTKYGPYIVLMPNVAMPHSTENANGVNKTAIAFMKVEEPVLFEDNGSNTSAQLFFTIASCDSEKHLQNMQKLCELLTNESLIEGLVQAKTPEELITLHNKYLK